MKPVLLSDSVLQKRDLDWMVLPAGDKESSARERDLVCRKHFFVTHLSSVVACTESRDEVQDPTSARNG
jgi:hypothetical protein